MSLTTIYTHLRTLGAESENRYLITQELSLETKYSSAIRFILQILVKIPFFSFIKERTDIDGVIHAVNSHAINAVPREGEIQKADFIIKILQILKQKRDPHLEKFQKINQLSHRVKSDILSEEAQAKLLADTKAIETSYFQGDDIAPALEMLEAQVTLVKTSEKSTDEAAIHINSSALSEKKKALFNSQLEKIKRMPLLTTDIMPLLSDLNSTVAEKNADVKAKNRLITLVKGEPNPLAVTIGLLFFPPFAFMETACPFVDENTINLNDVDQCLARGVIDKKEKRYGYTPLIYSAYNGLPRVAAHLIAKGASTEIKEKKGYNAYTMARYYLNKYSTSLALTEQKPLTADFTAEKKQKERDLSREQVAKYQELVSLLEPITLDRMMPRSFF